jgi:hypothetical protein
MTVREFRGVHGHALRPKHFFKFNLEISYEVAFEKLKIITTKLE